MDDFERRIPDIVDPHPDSVGGPPKVEDVHLATPDPALEDKPHLEPANVSPEGTPMPDPDPVLHETHAEETYARPEGEKQRRGPTADEIRNYRVGSERMDTPVHASKYNQPRSALDPARQSPNLRMGMAIASLVLGLIGFAMFWIPYFGFVTPVLAIIFGAVGLVQSQSQPEHFGGRGFAIAGIVLGLICLGLAFLSLSVLSCTVGWIRDAFQLR